MEGCSFEGPIPSGISALTSLSDLYAILLLYHLIPYSMKKEKRVHKMIVLGG